MRMTDLRFHMHTLLNNSDFMYRLERWKRSLMDT